MSAGQRIVSKTEVLVLRRPNSRRHRFIYVRASVGWGRLSLQSQERRCCFRKLRVDAEHDLKVVWVNDLVDDEDSNVTNCFVIVTPETSYILQGNTNRVKIEWMQALSIAISQTLKFRGSYRPSSWSNLDDLQKWLTVRDVEYEYQTDKTLQGAVYRGKWTMGMPHICGSMKWSNGDQYDGEFRYGKFHGTGTMLWLSDRTKRSYTGQWQEGMAVGYGEMTYVDHSVYTGWWYMGSRQGHGRMEYKLSGSVYVGAWDSDVRSGYGVFNNQQMSERYLGMWENDVYNGPGILLAENEFYYSGLFTDGERSLGGNGRSEAIIQDQKWDNLFQICRAMLEQMVNISHSLPDITHPSSAEENGIQPADSGLDVRGEDDIQAYSSEMDKSCKDCHTLGRSTEECLVCKVEGFKSAEHPFGILVNNLTKCFNESYSGVGAHKNLLPHAIGELSSTTTRLHQIVRELCPSVISTNEDDLLGKPRSQLTLLLRKRHKDLRRISMTSQHSQGWTDPSWLYPIMLPSIFPTIFDLYKEHYSLEDSRVARLMETLCQMDEKELCQILGLEGEYSLWENQHGSEGETGSRSANTTLSDLFSEAIDIFRSISDYLTPLNKLLCIQEANGAISQVWKMLQPEDDERPLSACSDATQITSTALMTFVIIKSQVENLCSEIQFIQDFAGRTLLTEEYGYLLSLLKDSYYQIDELQKADDEAATL